MSAVPKLRFPEFDGDLHTLEANEIAQIYDGTHQTPKYVDKGVPFFSVENLTSGNFEETKFISEEVYEKECRRVKIEQGDVLMTRIGDIGTVKYVNWPPRASFYVSLALLKFTDSVISEYMSHYMSANSFQSEIWRRTIHVAFPKKINLGEIGNCKVAFPSLPEQYKIASFLSSVDKKIDFLRQKKDALELYKKGLMQKIFSQEIRFKQDDGSDFPDWEEVALGKVVEVNSDKRKVPNKFYYIDLESVKGGVLTAPQEISSSDAPSRAQRVLSRGDILFQLVRPYQMNNLFFDCDGHFVASTGYAQLRSENNRFLFYLVHYEEFVAEVLKRSTGSNYPAINSNDLKTIQVSIPAMKEQEKIADFLSALDAKIQNTASQIEQMETFKKGLLQQMFV